MLIYFTEITILHISCYYYEYRSCILIILMLIYSVKSMVFLVLRYINTSFPGAIFPYVKYTEKSGNVTRIIQKDQDYRIRIIALGLVLQKVRIWVMSGFFLKTLVSCICLNFSGSEFHAATIFNCE